MTFYSILSVSRASGKSFVCDVNGFSFVKNSNKYYDDTSQILGNIILRTLAPKMHIPWSVPFQLDDPPIVSYFKLHENILIKMLFSRYQRLSVK